MLGLAKRVKARFLLSSTSGAFYLNDCSYLDDCSCLPSLTPPSQRSTVPRPNTLKRRRTGATSTLSDLAHATTKGSASLKP